MSLFDAIRSALPTVAHVLVLLIALSALELLVPLVARSPWRRSHLAPNLVLAAITLASNLLLGAVLISALATLAAREIGLLPWLGLAGPFEIAASVVLLDLSFYVAHVSMHSVPVFWRFHAVHHCDPLVDATTTLRQHPGETLIRFAFTSAFACALGVSPAAYVVYRASVAVFGLLEHSNLRIPPRIDRALALVTTWPGFHKVHHAREAASTNSNYGNLLSSWDRLFGNCSSEPRSKPLPYGLDGHFDDEVQTLRGLLTLPARPRSPARRIARAASPGGRWIRFQSSSCSSRLDPGDPDPMAVGGTRSSASSCVSATEAST